MSAPSNPLVVLDTSVLVHLLRQDATGAAIEQELGLAARTERPLVSVVTEGELRALAILWHWGEGKVGALGALLDQLVLVELGHAPLVQAYAELYAAATRLGQPRGENDLWIAATAKAAKAELVTCDTDFGWLGDYQVLVHYFAERR